MRSRSRAQLARRQLSEFHPGPRSPDPPRVTEARGTGTPSGARHGTRCRSAARLPPRSPQAGRCPWFPTLNSPRRGSRNPHHYPAGSGPPDSNADSTRRAASAAITATQGKPVRQAQQSSGAAARKHARPPRLSVRSPVRPESAHTGLNQAWGGTRRD